MIDIEERWSLVDVADAHDVIDLYERLESRQAAEVEASARSRRKG